MRRENCLMKLTLICCMSLLPSPVQAQTYLSQVALFIRCYAQLTQQRPAITDPLLAQVKAGSKTALAACTEVLDRAKLTAANNTKLANESDPVAKAVLNSFHQLHRSWARDKGVILRDGESNAGTAVQGWYEDSPMGAYVTRALFSPGNDVTSIISGTDFLQPVRTNMNPPRAVPGNSAATPRDWILGANQPVAPRDDLIGIRAVNIAPISFLAAVPFTNAAPDYANIGTSPVASVPVTTINFANKAQISAPLTQTTLFAVKFRGNIQIPATAAYTFYLDADDSAILVIDGNRVTSGTAINLTAGSHRLAVNYFQSASEAKLIFSWKSPTIAKEIVPAAALKSVVADYYTKMRAAPMELTGSEGGGFIGSHNYLFTTYNQTSVTYTPDGQLKTDRSYARSVIYDSLCREVPVVREADAAQFVVPTSQTPFRQEAACAVCHATLDRAAGAAVRDLRWNVIPGSIATPPTPTLFGMTGIKKIAPTYAADPSWPATLDPSYAQRTPSGVFYFRNYRGQLISQNIASIADLAAAIRAQDDYYACFAKRYYRYFMGIDVELGDPGDPAYPRLNEADSYHREKVIQLGLALKQHKSLRQLILSIIGSNEYKMTDFGITYGGP